MCKQEINLFSDLETGIGSCQSGICPVVIVINDTANEHSPSATVVPLSSRMKNRNLPTYIILGQRETTGLNKSSMVLCEQVRILYKEKLGNHIRRIISREAMNRIIRGIQYRSGLLILNRRKVKLTRN